MVTEALRATFDNMPCWYSKSLGRRGLSVTNLLATAFLQPVDHLLKLKQADFHLLFQLVDKRVVVRIKVVVRLLCVQAESCRTTQ